MDGTDAGAAGVPPLSVEANPVTISLQPLNRSMKRTENPRQRDDQRREGLDEDIFVSCRGTGGVKRGFTITRVAIALPRQLETLESLYDVGNEYVMFNGSTQEQIDRMAGCCGSRQHLSRFSTAAKNWTIVWTHRIISMAMDHAR
jgi:hypothetical protein